ncbi:hypothetical protein [Aestuariivirga sp.]|uniref:hypothetical protein n=1 Tax=Aestuariivirga sp. TaxID=2650926 RepID=UPI0039E4B7DE
MVYETGEGAAGEAALSLFTRTVIEQRDGVTLSSFLTEGNSNKSDTLTDQVTPANLFPRGQYFETAGSWTVGLPSNGGGVVNNRAKPQLRVV